MEPGEIEDFKHFSADEMPVHNIVFRELFRHMRARP